MQKQKPKTIINEKQDPAKCTEHKCRENIACPGLSQRKLAKGHMMPGWGSGNWFCPNGRSCVTGTLLPCRSWQHYCFDPALATILQMCKELFHCLVLFCLYKSSVWIFVECCGFLCMSQSLQTGSLSLVRCNSAAPYFWFDAAARMFSHSLQVSLPSKWIIWFCPDNFPHRTLFLPPVLRC